MLSKLKMLHIFSGSNALRLSLGSDDLGSDNAPSLIGSGSGAVFAFI